MGATGPTQVRTVNDVHSPSQSGVAIAVLEDTARLMNCHDRRRVSRVDDNRRSSPFQEVRYPFTQERPKGT